MNCTKSQRKFGIVFGLAEAEDDKPPATLPPHTVHFGDGYYAGRCPTQAPARFLDAEDVFRSGAREIGDDNHGTHDSESIRPRVAKPSRRFLMQMKHTF